MDLASDFGRLIADIYGLDQRSIKQSDRHGVGHPRERDVSQACIHHERSRSSFPVLSYPPSGARSWSWYRGSLPHELWWRCFPPLTSSSRSALFVCASGRSLARSLASSFDRSLELPHLPWNRVTFVVRRNKTPETACYTHIRTHARFPRRRKDAPRADGRGDSRGKRCLDLGGMRRTGV